MDTAMDVRTMRVVGDPKKPGVTARQDILRELIRREALNLPSPTWMELGDAIGANFSTVVYHVKILRRAGLVTFEDGKPRTLRTTPKARLEP